VSDGRYSIGVDLGGTYLKLALLDGAGGIVARETVPTGASEGHAAVLRRMAEGVRRLSGSVPEGEIDAVGVGIPGLVDMASGVTEDLANLPGRWHGVAVGSDLAKATGLPVHLINDARAFVVAEHAMGAAAGAETALCVTVGTGIGGGLVAHGRVVFGLGGAAGEIGHLTVHAGGARCTCGNRGCVEPLASGPGIVSEAIRRIVQGFTTELTGLVGGDLNAMTPELVAQAAGAGDEVATEVLEEAGSYLGLALAGAIATVAPEVVVLGGGVAQPGGIYWRAAEATARSHSHVTDIERIAFRPAALGYDAGVIGAALWGRQQARGEIGATAR
jgi:glucokinase